LASAQGWRHGPPREDVYWDNGCQITRTFFRDGSVREQRFCPSTNRGHGRYRDWDDARDDDDDDDDRRHYRSGYGDIGYGDYFGDRHRRAYSAYYGRRCDTWHDGHRRPYRVGQRYDRSWGWSSPSNDLIRHLGPAPQGYGYTRYNDDVLLVALASGLIVDALVASGR
jgi:Ni/Co efflux regulator RcnB